MAMIKKIRKWFYVLAPITMIIVTPNPIRWAMIVGVALGFLSGSHLTEIWRDEEEGPEI